MSLRSSLTLSLVLAAGLTVAACDRSATDAAQESTASSAETGAGGTIDRGQAGALMPTATIEDPQGRKLNLAALQGRPVLVNLWATWCAPCVKEMPLLDGLAEDYGDELEVITVSQDMAGAEKVVPFFAEHAFERLEPWMDPAMELGFAIGGGTLPTTVLYDASGREVWRVVGDFDWSSEEARAAIDAVIAG